ncbi:MAG: hypothetical protein KDD52_04510 [Bdellovibrionales bacterium]|nr:hypothetical protein [Bdellovibrionales bacterium]
MTLNLNCQDNSIQAPFYKNIYITGALFFLVCTLLACQKLIELSYKTYADPNYGYTLSYPRSWELKEGGSLGTSLVLLSPDEGQLFRANGNIAIAAVGDQKLKQQVEQSIKQLKFVLREYELISKVYKPVGSIQNGAEIRARYQAAEGLRIIRTFFAMTSSYTYVLTFTASSIHEREFSKKVNRIVQSFVPGQE